MKYKIGDIVWFAKYAKYTEERVACPTCAGKCFITVILGDGEKVETPCANCEQREPYGYDRVPVGYNIVHISKPAVEQLKITGVEINSYGDLEYKLRTESCSSYICTEKKILDSKEKAEEEAQKLADKKAKEQKEDIEKRKYNGKKSWAWNVSYHKKGIESCLKSIEHHEKKLYYAKQKVKRKA